MELLPNELKFVILGNLETEDIARAAAIPSLADVAAAILARGGRVAICANWVAEAKMGVFPIPDHHYLVSPWSDKEWEFSVDLTQSLPGLQALCQVADVKVEVALELDPPGDFLEVKLSAVERSLDSSSKLATADFAMKTLSLEIPVRPKDRDLELRCMVHHAYKEAPKITSSITIIINKKN